MKTLTTNMILVGRLKLHPLDLLLRMSPLAFAQCLFASWWTGELAKVREYSTTQMTSSACFGLAMNGMIAFFLNVVSFTVSPNSHRAVCGPFPDKPAKLFYKTNRPTRKHQLSQ
jgi:hypothetical protein